MELTQAIVFYLLFGCGVAVAVALQNSKGSRFDVWFRSITSFCFWPLYVPMLLQPSRPLTLAAPVRTATPGDPLAAVIDRTEAELDSALGSLDGWAEGLLAAERDRFGELRAAWRAQAERIRQLDRLLAQPDFTAEPTVAPPTTPVSEDVPAPGPLAQSEQARVENILKLRSVRGKLHDDLLETLAKVRELVTSIHLAKYSDAPASREKELVTRIAVAVEGLSESTQRRQESGDRN